MNTKIEREDLKGVRRRRYGSLEGKGKPNKRKEKLKPQ